MTPDPAARLDRFLGQPRRWSSIAREFVWDLRNSLLAERPTLSDGSEGTDVLAARTVIRSALPCPVQVYDLGPTLAVRLQLGGLPFAFAVGDSTELYADFADLRPDTTAVVDASEESPAVLLQLTRSVPEPVSAWFVNRHVADALSPLIGAEARRLLSLRTTAFDELGYRLVEVPLPSGPPARQFDAVRRGELSEPRQLTPEALRDDLYRFSRVLDLVPDGIDSILQVSRLHYIYGWEEWQFLNGASHYAALALEASVRALWERTLQDKAIVKGVDPDGSPVTKVVQPTYEAVRAAARMVSGATVNGDPVPRAKDGLVDRLVAAGALSRWEAGRVRSLLSLRDILSHPGMAFYSWIGDVQRDLGNCVLLINTMWARWLAELPRDFAWDPTQTPAIRAESARP